MDPLLGYFVVFIFGAMVQHVQLTVVWHAGRQIALVRVPGCSLMLEKLVRGQQADSWAGKFASTCVGRTFGMLSVVFPRKVGKLPNIPLSSCGTTIVRVSRIPFGFPLNQPRREHTLCSCRGADFE